MTWSAPEALLGFARALRAAGLSATADRERAFLAACHETGVADRSAVYWAGRATLTAGPADLTPYDQVFHAWFSPRPRGAVGREDRARPAVTQAPLEDGSGAGGDGAQALVRAVASDVEVLRHRDVGRLAQAERALLRAQFARLRPCPPSRRARRRVPARRGEVDGPATLRRQLRRMGEPGPVARRRRGTRPRQVVLLVDVSGSMSAYSDSLLRLAHRMVRAAPRSTAVFTLGTRLTPVTRALRQRDPDRALREAGEAVADWSGGTRLGETLGAFLDRWGRRGLARRAVVVVLSDGWERDGAEELGEQMRRLHALAHRVVWVNPHRGRAGYAPVQQGMLAALPHVDDVVAGHSLATFEELLELVGRA